jgi:hypothetical protein
VPDAPCKKRKISKVKKLLYLSVVLSAAIAVFALICLFTPVANRCDFKYRMAEVDCIAHGVDPFKVWNEEVVFKPYYSNNPARRDIPEGCTEMISVYAPWEYTLMFPFRMFGVEAAWWIFSAVCFLLIFSVVAIVGRESVKGGFDGEKPLLLALLPMMAVSYPVWSNFQVGNHMAIALAGAVFMGVCLNSGRNAAAGICWMLVMIKPQIGLIFAVPLLLRMRVLTGFVAAGLCILLSLPPVIACKASFFDMLREPSMATAFAFEGCGTWPKFLCGYFSNGTDIAMGLVIGTVLCLWMTWMLRREKDWLVYLMPAAVCSLCWTYTQAYSHAMGWFLAYAITKELLRNPRSKAMWIFSVLSLIALPRFILAWHGLYTYMGWHFPMSEFMYRSIDSLNSSFTLGLAAIFCVIVNRQNSPSITA